MAFLLAASVCGAPPPRSGSALAHGSNISLATPTLGLVWWDRHNHKNGGTTVRDIMQMAAAQGSCMYWGYWQSLKPWSAVLPLLVSSPADQSSRLCVEAHYPVDEPSILSRNAQLQKLKEAAAGKVRVVRTTRVREPLEYYLSYYKWTIGGHQLSGEAQYGASFLEWSPPNLQSNLMLYPTRSVSLEEGRGYEELMAYNESDAEKLTKMLDMFELVGTADRFDEFAVMLSHVTGIDPRFKVEEPPQLHLPSNATPMSNATVCPDMAKCEAHVRKLAPLDYAMYNRYAAKFDELLSAMGPGIPNELVDLRRPTLDGWLGRPLRSARCVWTEKDEMTMERDGEAPCDVASEAVKQQIKLDLFEHEAGEKAFVPADMAKAALARKFAQKFSQKFAQQVKPNNLAHLDMQVLVSGDGRERKWAVSHEVAAFSKVAEGPADSNVWLASADASSIF